MRKLDLQEFVDEIYIDYKKNGDTQYLFFLGAGCSKSSGIPLAGELAEKWYSELEDQKIKFDKFNKAKKIPKKNIDFGKYYFEIFEELFPTPLSQQQEIQRITNDEKVNPSLGYYVLASLMQELQFNTIITTNFDNLIQDSLIYSGNKRARVITHQDLSQFIKRDNTPLLTKIHGDAHLNPFNNKENTKEIPEPLKGAIQGLFTNTKVIFIGYRGDDESIVDLLEGCNRIDQVYWLSSKKPKKSKIFKWWKKIKNKTFIKERDFDKIMGLIKSKFDLESPNFSKLAETLQNSYNRALEDEINEIKGIKDEDKSALDYLLLGNTYVSQKKYTEAIEAYNSLIQIEPESDSAYFNKGIVYSKLEEYEKAIEEYEKAIKINPNYNSAYNNMGNIYNNLTEYEKAVEQYEKAIEINSKYDKAYNNMGIAYDNLEKYEKAILSYEKAIEINPKKDEAYYNMGNAYNKLEKYEKAISSYEKAIEINPKKDEAYSNMGNAYNKLEKYEKAISSYEKAIEINPKKDEVYYNMGNAYNKLEKYEKGISSYEKAIEINPKKDEAYSNMGNAYNKLEKYEKAISSYEKAIEINPKKDEVYYNMGNAYNKLEKYEKGISSYEKAIEINPKKDEAYYNMGITYNKLEKYEKAISSYEKAIEINPKSDNAYTNLFERELIGNKPFQKELESEYIQLFKEDKNIFMQYELLKILSQINDGIEVDTDKWLENYKEQNLNGWSFDELETWANTKDSPIKEKLLEAIEIFKTKKED